MFSKRGLTLIEAEECIVATIAIIQNGNMTDFSTQTPDKDGLGFFISGECNFN